MKLRIISGIYGGRLIKSPAGHKTHPMSEKMRGAIFNILGDVKGLSLLDAYSGSGAVAFEAISRGALRVVAVDSDKKAVDIIKENSLNLGVDLKVSRANINSWIETNPNLSFDIVVCDPPYDNVNSVQLAKVANTTKVQGIVVFSLPPTISPQLNQGFQEISKKTYNDSILVFYKRIV